MLNLKPSQTQIGNIKDLIAKGNGTLSGGLSGIDGESQGATLILQRAR